eukprot:101543_1
MSFKSECDLKHHQITHSGTRLTDKCDTLSFTSNSYDNTFKRQSNVSHHQCNTIDERPFQCDISECEKSFKSRQALKYHQTTRSNVRPIQCSLCEKSFKSKSLLVTHQITHSDAR